MEPIVGVEPWMMMKLHSSNGDISGSDTDDIVDSNDAGGDSKQQQQTIHPNHNRINLIQQMVKLHATYNEENKKGTNDQQESSTATNTDTTVISWSEDDVDDNDDNNDDDDIVKIYRSIAVQQSLPSFIVRLWVKQYGAAASNIIAQRANKPGPITLRRNALRCKSDNELLRRLKKEGDIDAYVFDGGSDSDSDTGDVEGRRMHYAPKEGCIQLFRFDGQRSEKKNNATTTNIPHPRRQRQRQRQRRPNKSLWSLQSWQDGWFEVQDVGSQLIVDAVEVQYGDVVIDYCAGNGGKTLALASHMWNNNNNNDNHNRLEEEDDDYNDHDTTTTTTSTIPKSEDGGTIIAHDVVESRLAQIRGSLARAGLVVDDDEEEQQLQQSPRRRRIPPRVVTTSNATQLSELDAELADAVLVDAPCSSLGVLRRRPGHRWTLTESTICEDFPKLQLDILKNASLLVKPSGGKLVYATCSICKEENENVVKQFEELSFSIDNDQHHHDDDDGLLLLFEDVWERWKFDGTDSHCRSTVIPHVENGDCDGFFVARWKRKGVVDIL